MPVKEPTSKSHQAELNKASQNTMRVKPQVANSLFPLYKTLLSTDTKTKTMFRLPHIYWSAFTAAAAAAVATSGRWLRSRHQTTISALQITKCS